MNIDLTITWGLIIVVAVFIYVVLDGFDLGIGTLFNTFSVGHDRDTAMNSVAPVWDGNETWLVMGGGGLLAAFPLAYGLITWVTGGNQRVAIACTTVLFVLGLLALTRIDVQRGRAARLAA